MQHEITEKTILRAPATVVERAGPALVAIDPASPNWITTDERGISILRRFDGRTPLGDVVRDYAAEVGTDVHRAWLHVETFARDALRQRFISTDGAVPQPYLGRAAYLRTDQLREFWIQINDFCNLACEHCLVSSSPQGGQGLDGSLVKQTIDQAVALGVERFFLTGGEPLARVDATDLIDHVVRVHERELVVLTNGTLLRGERLAEPGPVAVPFVEGGRAQLAAGLRGQQAHPLAEAEQRPPLAGQHLPPLFLGLRVAGQHRTSLLGPPIAVVS